MLRVQHLPHFFGQIVLTMKHQNGLMMRQKGRLSRQVSGALVVTVPPPPPLPPSDLPHTIPGKIEYVFFIHIFKSLDEPEPSLDIAKSFDGYEPQSISISDFYQPFAAMVIRRPTSLDLLLLLDLGPFTPKISPQAPKPPNPPNQII